MLIKKIRSSFYVLLISLFGFSILFFSEIKTSTNSLISKKDQENKDLPCKSITNLTGLKPDVIKIISDYLGFSIINLTGLNPDLHKLVVDYLGFELIDHFSDTLVLPSNNKAFIKSTDLINLDYSPDGKQIAILMRNVEQEGFGNCFHRTVYKILILNLETKVIQRISVDHSSKFIKFLNANMIASSNHKTVSSFTRESSVSGTAINLIDISKRRSIKKIVCTDPYSNILTLGLTKSGSELVALLGNEYNSDESIIKIWDIETGILKKEFNYPGYFLRFNNNLLAAHNVDFIQNDGFCELKIRVGDLDKGLNEDIFQSITLKGDRCELKILNDKQVLIYDYHTLNVNPSAITILDLTSKQVTNITNFKSPADSTLKSNFTFSPDGKYMAARPYGKDEENNLKIFDLQSHLLQSKIIKELGQIESGKSEIRSIIFSPCSENIIVAYKDRISVFKNNYKFLLYEIIFSWLSIRPCCDKEQSLCELHNV